MNEETITLEIIETELSLKEKAWAFLSLFILAFSFIFCLLEVNDDKHVSKNILLIGVLSVVMLQLYIVYIKKPVISGELKIGYNSLAINNNEFDIKQISYFCIKYIDYKGKFIFKRNELPLPRRGVDNKIEVRLKEGNSFTANFLVRRRKDRKKIDRFIYHWMKEGVELDYYYGNNHITSK